MAFLERYVHISSYFGRGMGRSCRWVQWQRTSYSTEQPQSSPPWPAATKDTTDIFIILSPTSSFIPELKKTATERCFTVQGKP